MVDIKLNGEEYLICESIADLTIGQYCKLLQIMGRREKKLEMVTVDGEEIWETIEQGNESKEFLDERNLDFLCVITDIPREFYTEYPELQEVVNEFIGDYFNDSSAVIYEIQVKGKKHIRLPITEWTFQQWSDAEGMIQMQESYTLLGLLCIIFQEDGAIYNRLHPDFDSKIKSISSLPAIKLAATLSEILNDMEYMRKAHKFIYEVSVGEAVGKKMAGHLDMFKWEDTIVQLAQSNVFNSPSGTLNGVRNANLLDVLQYLNVKKSRDVAEYLDMQKKNNIINPID